LHAYVFPDFKVTKVNRSGNRLAHELVALGRRELRGLLLLGSVPSCVAELTKKNCNPNLVSKLNTSQFAKKKKNETRNFLVLKDRPLKFEWWQHKLFQKMVTAKLEIFTKE
jgi:hypothetical protein